MAIIETAEGGDAGISSPIGLLILTCSPSKKFLQAERWNRAFAVALSPLLSMLVIRSRRTSMSLHPNIDSGDGIARHAEGIACRCGRTRARMTVPHDRPIGRPLAASEKQRVDVRNRRKAGEGLRSIAHATNLSVRSVRTVVEKDAGTDRTSKRAKELRRNEFTRQRAAAFRARKKAHEALPGQVRELQKTGAKLIKRAKGLDL